MDRVNFPNEKKCLKVLRKVFPDAKFTRLDTTEKGIGLEATYLFNGHLAPIGVARGPKLGLLPFMITREAFRKLGFETTWDFAKGEFKFEAIKGYVGPEDSLPVELDPREPLPEGFDSGNVAKPLGAETPNTNERPQNGHDDEEP